MRVSLRRPWKIRRNNLKSLVHEIASFTCSGIAITILLAVNASAAVQKVSVRTADGVSLSALYLKPSQNKPTVIMLHGLSSVKEEWQPLIQECEKKGIGALAYDSRPAGTPWPKLVDDVGAMIRFLEGKDHVDRKNVVLAGASLGANVCLKYHALSGAGRAAVLLSPGLNYQGLAIDGVVPKIKTTPLLFVASPADQYAFQSCLQLVPKAGNANFWSSQKPGHGVQMFDEGLLDRLTKWIEQQK